MKLHASRRYEIHRSKLDRNRKPKRTFRYYFVPIFVVLVLLGIPFFFSYASFFSIQEIRIEGLTTVVPSDVENFARIELDRKRLGLFPQKSTFFLHKKRLQERVQSEFSFSETSVTLYHRELVISASEPIAEIIFLNQATYFFLDLTGGIVAPLNASERNGIRMRLGLPVETAEDELVTMRPIQPTTPVISNTLQEDILSGEPIFTSEEVSTILFFDDEIRRLGIGILQYEIEGTGSKWLRAQTELGIAILFELTVPVPDQIETLTVVLDQYSDQLSELEYIDIRFGNHVFVK
jgi:hypothetical protein